eukprot:gene28126-34809_t
MSFHGRSESGLEYSPNVTPTHLVKYGQEVRKSVGTTPTVALRTGGGFLYQTGTPARYSGAFENPPPPPTVDKTRALEKTLFELEEEALSLRVELDSMKSQLRHTTDDARAAVAVRDETHRELVTSQLENKAIRSIKDALERELDTLKQVERPTLQVVAEIESLRETHKAALKDAEIRSAGLADYAQKLKEELG